MASDWHQGNIIMEWIPGGFLRSLLGFFMGGLVGFVEFGVLKEFLLVGFHGGPSGTWLVGWGFGWVLDWFGVLKGF